MPADHAPRAAHEHSGAFVARVWHDEDGLRARVRHTADLADPEHVATLTGEPAGVVPDLVGRFRRWIEEFAARTGAPAGVDDGSMTSR